MNARTAWWNVATWVAGGAIALLAVVWSADVPMRIGLLLYSEQLVAAMIGFAVFGAFLRRPNDARPAPLEIACAIAGLVAGLWIACRYPVLQADVRGHATEGMVLGIVVIALAVEACRRGSGWSMPVIFGLFLAYALFGHHFAGIWQTKAIRFERLIAYLALDTSSLLGPTMIIVCTTVLVFMMFGRVLQACGGGEFFTDLSSALFGQFRGGTGKVEVVASAFFGSISGSAMANVMSTGIITIPNMKRAGYKPETAAAVEAVSSTGGQIVPPVMGAAAFLMAENLGVRYADVAIAAIVPAALYFFSVFVQVDYESAARGIGGIPRSERPRTGAASAGLVLRPAVRAAVRAHVQRQPAGRRGGAVEHALGDSVRRIPRLPRRKALAAPLLRGGVRHGRDSFELLTICAVAAIVIGLLNITGLALSLGLALVKIGEAV